MGAIDIPSGVAVEPAPDGAVATSSTVQPVRRVTCGKPRGGEAMDLHSPCFRGYVWASAKSIAAQTAATWASLHCSAVARGLSG